MKKKIILAYSGGLDSTVCIPWLKENQDCDVIAVCVDLGQTADWKAIQKQALACGASAFYAADAKKEYVEDYLWPVLKAGAVYENKNFLGTATARSLVAKVLIEYARKEKASAIAHGSACKGNEQGRLDPGLAALAPDLEIIAPWRVWRLKSREDAIRYLARRKLPVPVKKKKNYNIDSNLWFTSFDGLELDDVSAEPLYKKLLQRTVTPEKAPNKPVYVEIEFEKGIPTALNGKKMDGNALINALNKTGGANGIGITDLIENDTNGNKVRTVYETPGGSILHYAHQELESLCLDRQTFSYKQQVSLKFGKLVYRGKWFSPLREALCAFVDRTQKNINGKVKVKLYKGSISAAGVSSPNSLYTADTAGAAAGKAPAKSASKAKPAGNKGKAASGKGKPAKK